MNTEQEKVDFYTGSNPLDSIEDVLVNQDWVFERRHDDEIKVTVSGTLGNYLITFLWLENEKSLLFKCVYDISFLKENKDVVAQTLMSINPRLWLGHFELDEKSLTPCFRYTTMFRGWPKTTGTDQIEDLIEYALMECEHYYNIFNLLSKSVTINNACLDLALMDSKGVA